MGENNAPNWAKGLIFSFVFVVLIFILKVLCPINLGCLADPFLLIIFSPLTVLDLFSINLGRFEPLYIILFWSILGAFLGSIYSKFFDHQTKN